MQFLVALDSSEVVRNNERGIEKHWKARQNEGLQQRKAQTECDLIRFEHHRTLCRLVAHLASGRGLSSPGKKMTVMYASLALSFYLPMLFWTRHDVLKVKHDLDRVGLVKHLSCYSGTRQDVLKAKCD